MSDAHTAAEIADVEHFVKASIRDFPDFCEDVLRLSTADRRTAKLIRKDIYDTIDRRVRNAVSAAQSPLELEIERLRERLSAFGVL